MEKIALIGRPNVGKSTLFNRLIRSKRAITHDRAGITRDRMEGRVRVDDRRFIIIDTGGITLDSHAAVAEGPAESRGFEAEILRQAEIAVKEASALAMVVDGREGLTPFDESIASYIRKSGLPILLVVNKIDGEEKAEQLMADFHILGFEILPVSAEHGFNIRALREELAMMLPESAVEDDELDDEEDDALDDAAKADAEEKAAAIAAAKAEEGKTEPSRPQTPEKGLKLAMLGRPNAGKSSLTNSLLGEDRMIVSDLAGTTRDSVDTVMERNGEIFTFVDTAGVRRRSKIEDPVERYSVNSSIKSTTKADVTLVVIDATEGLTQQDKRLIDLLDERKTPFMIVLNKVDLIPRDGLAALKQNFKDAMTFCNHVPVLCVSAKKRRGVEKIIPMAKQIKAECFVRVGTGVLNRAMDTVLTKHQPPVVKRARPKFFYLTQAETNPPTFVFFVSDSERIKEDYSRYLEKSLRAMFGVVHAPMRVRFRSSHNKKNDKK